MKIALDYIICHMFLQLITCSGEFLFHFAHFHLIKLVFFLPNVIPHSYLHEKHHSTKLQLFTIVISSI